MPFQEIPRQARNDHKLSRKSACIFSAYADDSPRRGCAATILRITQKKRRPKFARGDDGQARRTKRLRLSESNAGHSRAKQNATFVALVEMTTSEADEKPKAFQEACADDSPRRGCAATVLRITQKKRRPVWTSFCVELITRFELVTSSLPRMRSTD